MGELHLVSSLSFTGIADTSISVFTAAISSPAVHGFKLKEGD